MEDNEISQYVRIRESLTEQYRKYPHWIFHRDARPNPHHLSGFLLSQMTLLGARDVQLKRVNDWYIFTADLDWLQAGSHVYFGVLDQFDGIVTFPEDGINRQRYESAIKAFSDAVIIADQREVTVVSGEVPDDSEIWQHITTKYPRTLAFLFPFTGTAYKNPNSEEDASGL